MADTSNDENELVKVTVGDQHYQVASSLLEQLVETYPHVPDAASVLLIMCQWVLGTQIDDGVREYNTQAFLSTLREMISVPDFH